MKKSSTATPAPAWLARAMTPFIARTVAREMIKKYPGLGADAIIEKMRAEMSSSDPQAEQLLQAVARRLPDRPATVTDRTATHAIAWYSPSSLVLIAANLLPLYGVLILGWPVFPLILLFWLENVVIGLLNALRMLLVDPTDSVLWASKLFMVPFFCFHFGFFTAIHGTFVVSLFGGKAYRQLDHGLWPIEGASRAIVDFDLKWALAGLAISHVFSFLWNYLGRGEYRRAALTELMKRPYSRIVVLHLTIIIGGGIAMTLGSPLWALLLLVGLKISFDVKAHIKEHRKAKASV
jgi:hypothetical protein